MTKITGIEAANIVAEYLNMRGIGDAGDAANIIHILHSSGVQFHHPPAPIESPDARKRHGYPDADDQGNDPLGLARGEK